MKVHESISVRAMLMWTRKDIRANMQHCFDDDGNPFTSVKKFRQALQHELSKGHEVLPSPGCDNFDYQKGCLGHEEKKPTEIIQ